MQTSKQEVLILLQGFFAGSLVVYFSAKINISKFRFDQETVDEEPLPGYATANSQLFIYLFIYEIQSQESITKHRIDKE